MKSKMILSSVFNIFLYSLSGFAAPYIFRNFADRRMAGIIAGMLFMMAALRGVRLSLERPYAKWTLKFFGGLFLIELCFWLWRIIFPGPSDAVRILHPIMSGLYVISVGILIYSEMKWMRKN